MFVSVVLDPSNVENARAEAAVLTRFGFNKVQRACWETMSLSENQLNLLKRELDSVTDYYDTLRIYQFPVNGNFAITTLNQKKWKKAVFGSGQSAK